MTRGVRPMTPPDTVVLAAQAMDELNVGVIPVCDGEKLVGMVTDRDIVVRGVAQDCDNKSTRLADVMSRNVRWAREDEDVEQVLDEMAKAQIRRLPVVDNSQRLVGIISLGDVADKDSEDQDKVAASLGNISFPSQPDRSSLSQASGTAGGGQSRKPARRS
jgi:CBS domain-containing protein